MNTRSKIFLLLLFSTTLFAQDDLCTKAGFERGGFTFDGPSTACIGQEIKLRDNSGGTGVKYIFGYTPGLDINSTPSQTDTKYTFLAPGQYTVLQFGKKGGREMYYCDVVYIRESNKPDISYETCHNTHITLTIRSTPANNFDNYRISWSDGSVTNVPPGTTLPYNVSKVFTPSPTQNVLIEGIYTTPNSCPAPQPMSIKMARGDMFPRIEKIELSEDGKEATVKLLGNPDADYFLATRAIDQPGVVPNNTMPKVKAGSFKVPIPNPLKNFCFAVGRIGPGGCYEFSNEVCSLPFSLNPIDEQNQVAWNDISTGQIANSGVYTFINQITTQIVRDENGTNPITFNNPTNPFIDNTADCSKKYCYTLTSQVTVSYSGYTDPSFIETITVSQKQCINRSTIHPPAITDGFVNVNSSNAVQFTYNDNSSWTLNRKKYLFYRLENNLPKKIDERTIQGSFTDATIDASKDSYCYKVSFIDKCDSEAELSPAFCSIYLTSKASNVLDWTNDSPFGSTNINQIEVISFDETTDVPSVEKTFNGNVVTYSPSLDNFDELAKFQIKTISNDGKVSLSNVFTLPIKVRLFLPDIFSPNNDSFNEVLEVKGNTGRIIEFKLSIFNRWGTPIFTSDIISNSWNGTYQNTIVPPDVYLYKIYAKLNDGQILNKEGQFMLLR